ncbi:MAG: hypothetical protein RR969_01880 [Thermomonas sp.]
MNLPVLFLFAVSAWVMGWGVFLGAAWCTTRAFDPHPMSLLDHDIHSLESTETDR